MVEPVAALLNGRGHPVRRAREVGLAAEEDIVIIEYALETDLVIVTFDPDFRSKRAAQRRKMPTHPPPRANGSPAPEDSLQGRR